jgi:hypothetical protein
MIDSTSYTALGLAWDTLDATTPASTHPVESTI